MPFASLLPVGVEVGRDIWQTIGKADSLGEACEGVQVETKGCGKEPAGHAGLKNEAKHNNGSFHTFHSSLALRTKQAA